MHTAPYIANIHTGHRITCRTFEQAIELFYRQWRNEDGSIPWVIVSDGATITEWDLIT